MPSTVIKNSNLRVKVPLKNLNSWGLHSKVEGQIIISDSKTLISACQDVAQKTYLNGLVWVQYTYSLPYLLRSFFLSDASDVFIVTWPTYSLSKKFGVTQLNH